MDYVHQRFLQYFIEQDVVGHMEVELEARTRPRPGARAIAFADLAGYTRYTEEEGEEEALPSSSGSSRPFNTLPDDARVVKTIGDEVMIVAQDVHPRGLGGRLHEPLGSDPAPHRDPLRVRVYRDGDYFGREVNLASRMGRARGGEVVVTGAAQEAIGGRTTSRSTRSAR